MKKIIAAACGIAACATLSSAAYAGECSTASLKGHYTYWLQGFDAAGKPYAEVGQEHFNGKGEVMTKMSVAGKAGVEEDNGKVEINADCTGTIKYESGSSDSIFVVPSGDSFVFSSAKDGIVQVGEETRADKD